jgi:hypothetical protein
LLWIFLSFFGSSSLKWFVVNLNLNYVFNLQLDFCFTLGPNYNLVKVIGVLVTRGVTPQLLQKCHINLSHSFYNSTVSLFYLLPSQSITPLQLHHYHHSLLSLSHAHRPFAQWHPRWWINRSFFASQTVYQYVNSLVKRYFKTPQYRAELSTSMWYMSMKWQPKYELTFKIRSCRPYFHQLKFSHYYLLSSMLKWRLLNLSLLRVCC